MSRILQDQFIDDDEEETCPLCVEEFDLSDKGFRPCPCGYQICQFCYHNVRNNMNGLCPACRRPYDDANIEFRKPSPEEEALWKAKQAQRQKKTQVAMQKEAQKREADTLSRKHLAGLRVVQKNLVYVTGLNPKVQEDRLLETLRGELFFGQYGKIVKIVVSKAKDVVTHPQSVGVYVTYARKEDAASCIAAVDGSQNGDRTLRAQFGTTKYCSAYLRNEQCGNRNCMFLHEPGEDNDSFTRQDLSSMNVISTQQPNQASSHAPQPPPQSQQPVAAARPRQDTNTAPQSPHDGAEAPGLPSSASWASKAPQAQLARSASRAASSTSGSPAVQKAVPVESPQQESVPEPAALPAASEPEEEKVQAPIDAPEPAPPAQYKQHPSAFSGLIKTFISFDFNSLRFNEEIFSPEDLEFIKNHPPLFDSNGGAKIRARREREEAERRRLEAEAQVALQSVAAVEGEDNAEMSGSLQLGGEPEERQGAGQGVHQQHAIQPPSQQQALGNLGADPNQSLSNDLASLNLRAGSLTPSQQQQLLLQSFRTPSAQGSSYPNQQAQASAYPPGHARNVSRYTFANDTASASASVKPVANSKLMTQQSSMMPSQQQPFYTSTVQGPPPGLKTTGTPPVSGGGMFGQGHGFATSGLGYGANVTGRNANDELMRQLLRDRNLGSSQVSDAGKREYMISSFLHQNPPSTAPASAPGLLSFPYGPSPAAFQEAGPQKPKKKGKKHRHANTSSSGGGVVDVADPSILQARLHQGGNSAGQQGLFAGQGQAGTDFHSLGSLGGEEVFTDFPGSPRPFSPSEFDEPRRATPPVPPGLAGLGQSIPPGLETPRRATPTIPPGFQGHPLSRPTSPTPKDAASPTPSRPSSRVSMKRTASGITPAVPVLPATPVRAPTPLRQETKPKAAASAEVATPTKPSAARRLEAVHNRAGEVKPTEPTPEHDLTEAKAPQPEPISEKAAPAQKKPKDVVKEAAGPSTVEIIKETPAESKPILKTWASSVAQGEPQQIAKPKAENLTSDVPGVKSDANANQADIIAPLPVKEPLAVKQDMKRKHPGKLDITAAVTQPVEPSVVSTTSTMARAETPGKLVRPGSIPPVASRPESPATVAESPIKRTAPRTLRVVSTPKAETPPPAPAPPMPAPVVRLPSRKPSVASINVPGTPSSEHISDTISLTSTSVSRANSPPPGGKVGTAPVRAKTKNQVKKERQERARQLEEEAKKAAEESKPSEEPVQEAIMSRKKKTKKPAASTSSAAATPANVSRPATPKEQPKPEEPVKPVVQEQKVKEVIPSKPASPTPVTRPASPESPHQVTAASLVQDLRNSQSRLSAAFDALLRPLAQTAVHYKPSQPITPADLSVPRSLKRNPDVNILPEQLASMMAKQHPLRYGGEDGRIWSRGCITPGGAHLRHLEASLEERFLDLEKSFRALPEELRYHPLTGQNIKSIANEFPRIDLDALRREFESGAQRGRDANAMEKAVEEGQKKGSFLVDTAGKYVNEFVMPPVPVSPGTAAGAKVGAGVTKDGAYKDAAAVMAEQRERQTPLSLEEAERLLSDARKITEEKEAAVRRLIKGNRKKLGMSNAVVL